MRLRSVHDNEAQFVAIYLFLSLVLVILVWLHTTLYRGMFTVPTFFVSSSFHLFVHEKNSYIVASPLYLYGALTLLILLLKLDISYHWH